MIRLTVTRNDESLAVYEFDAEDVLVGRVPPADVLLASDGVSRRHARISRKDGAWRVADLGAANGVFIHNPGGMPGRVVVDPLCHGDVVAIEHFRIRFEEFPQARAAVQGLVAGTSASGEGNNPTAVLSLAAVQAAVEARAAPAPSRSPLEAHLALSAGIPVSLRTRAEATAAPWVLEVFEPRASAPRRVEVGAAPVQFGSDATCDVRLTGLAASRFAAAAEIEAGKLVVRRLSQGLLGTRLHVDGHPVKEAELAGGQKFTVGDVHVVVRAPPRDR